MFKRFYLTGAKECVEAAKQRIEEIVSDLEQQITLDCVIPQEHHRRLWDRRDRVSKRLKDFNVKIKFPEKLVENAELLITLMDNLPPQTPAVTEHRNPAPLFASLV